MQNPKLFKLSFLFVLVFIFASCTTPYIVRDFEEETLDHKTVAILPFNMVFTGQKPEGLTEDDLQEIAEGESKAFQVSFYNSLLRNAQGGKNRTITVDVQDYQKTWRILSEQQIDITESWAMAPEELAALLDVDAVVRARIQKHRLMSDLASFGIDLGIHILDALHSYHGGIWWLHGFSKAKEINADYALINRNNGRTLWQIAFAEEADWTQTSNEIINVINRRASRTFPYRGE